MMSTYPKFHEIRYVLRVGTRQEKIFFPGFEYDVEGLEDLSWCPG